MITTELAKLVGALTGLVLELTVTVTKANISWGIEQEIEKKMLAHDIDPNTKKPFTNAPRRSAQIEFDEDHHHVRMRTW